MLPSTLLFGQFRLDPANRRLTRDGEPIDIGARYLDALALLASEPGALISKDRFIGEVWRGIPVTDDALTQCIRALRRALGDDAAAPRFIETVPKHGYRFIAPVGRGNDADEEAGPDRKKRGFDRWREALLLGAAGTIGGGLAGFVGGLFYGFVGASEPLAPGMGAASVLLVLLCLTIAAALTGAAGVSFGIAAAGAFARRIGPWTVSGGAFGGSIVGAFAKLLGLDAFNLLIGRSPGDITGGPEGALLGAAVGLGAWLALRENDPVGLRRGASIAAVAGGLGGVLVVLLGGRLMGGSLDLLATSLPGSRLRLDRFGALVGEDGFGQGSQLVTGGLEGALFSACIVGAIILARRSLDESVRPGL